MSSEYDSAVGAAFLESQPAILTPTITKSSTPVALSGVSMQQYYVNANFDSPSGNNPSANSNMLFVWTGGPPIQFQNATVGSGTVSGILQSGNATATPSGGTPFFSTDYVIGYSVGPAVTVSSKPTYPNIVATAYIPGGVGSSLPIQYFGTTFGFVPNGISPTAIQFSYQFPPGVNPSQDNAFIGFWYSNINNVYGTTPQVTAQIFGPQSGGNAIMGGLALAAGGQYSAALYTSGYPLTTGATAPTNIAAWVQFSLSGG